VKYKHLHVLTSLFNPSGFAARYTRYFQFADWISKFQNVTLHTVEAIFPGQSYVATQADNPNHLQIELGQFLWYKENLINVLLKTIPNDGQPVAWIDADILFARPDWVEATLEALGKDDVVQMFSECQELTDQYTLLEGNLRRGMVYGVKHGHHLIYDGPMAYPRPGPITTTVGHCGYAWAARRDSLEALGGLMDFAILGSGDYHMATAWCGDTRVSIPGGVPESFREAIMEWQAMAQALGITVGYVPGIALHLWHGTRKDRGYMWRWKIYGDHDFNPKRDLVYDVRGLMSLANPESERIQAMQVAIKAYFDSRNEDAPST
jgi:hypothetical protein